MGNVGDSPVAAFEQPSCFVNSLGSEPPHRRGAGLRAEETDKGSRGVAGMERQVGDLKRVFEVLACPSAGVGQASPVWGQRSFKELSLAAATVRRDDESARHLRRGLSAAVSAQQVQAQIDTRGHTRACSDATVIDVEDIRVHTHPRVVVSQLSGVMPVRGGSPTVQQPGCSQRECSCADRHDPCAPPRGRTQLPLCQDLARQFWCRRFTAGGVIGDPGVCVDGGASRWGWR